MIGVEKFVGELKLQGINFFAGVPDSLLKAFCAYLQETEKHDKYIIAANEGNAIALAAGHYLATGKPACVYMQNSGIGNAVNPLLSLADREVYSIPMLLIIGWRGEPGKKDEPQHITQGKLTLPLLETMGIPHKILPDNDEEANRTVEEMVSLTKKSGQPCALVIKKDTFFPYKMNSSIQDKGELTREKAIETVVGNLPESAIIISTTGMASRELFEHREKHKESHKKDFLTVGSMGHASHIALGIALAEPNRKVVCLDGDGALLMHLGGLALIGNLSPENFIHIVFNNEAHDSVGGQPTVMNTVTLPRVISGLGYRNVYKVKGDSEIAEAVKECEDLKGPSFIEILVKKGARKDLGRPTLSPMENKNNFIGNILKN